MYFTTFRTTSLFAIIALLLSISLASCSKSMLPQSAGMTTVTPAVSVSIPQDISPTARPAQKSSSTLAAPTKRAPQNRPSATSIQKTITPTPSFAVTTEPSPIASLIVPGDHYTSAGTPIPIPNIPIGFTNLTRLEKSAQWGKGLVERIVYSPDGQSLLAGSPFGIAVYPAGHLDQPPHWLPFEYPVYFENIQPSKNGDLVRLLWQKEYPDNGIDSIAFNMTDGKFQPTDPSTEWVLSPYDSEGGYNKLTVTSSDNKLRFEGFTKYEENELEYGIEVSSVQIFDNQTGELKFRLKDETFYVHYEDYNQPDGCDLASFSMCGNVYDPNIMAPFRAAFSPTSRSLAVLYRAPNLWNSQNFSLLRVYSTQDGSLISYFGSFDQPVQDFTFQPGSDLITIAFVNGSIQSWDSARQKLLHQTWNFSPAVQNFAYSGDGRYLLVQYPNSVEALRTSDGAVAARYEASAFALSPRENLLAIGDINGGIQVEDLDQRQTVSRMEGHTAVIYALAFSQDGQALISSSEDCTIRSWDAHTGQFQHYFEKAEVDAIGEGWTKSRIFVYYLRFVPGSSQLVGFGSWGTAASWNINSGAKQYAVVSQPLEYYNGMVTLNPHFPQSFWVVPEESRFYIDEVAYDLKSGEQSGGYIPPRNLPKGCSSAGPVSLDGTIRFTPGYGHLAGHVCILNANDNRPLYTIPIYPGQDNGVVTIQQIFLSPDGTRMYITSLDGPIYVFQVRN